MKKTFFLVIILSATSSLFAGTPPMAVQEAFTQKFPGTKEVKWGKENATEWEANFIINETKISANFDSKGKWLETETEIPVTQLPPAVLASLQSNYPNWKVAGADKIESIKKGIFYEAVIQSAKKKKEVFLKEDGTFIK